MRFRARRARPARSFEVPGLTAGQRYHYLMGGLQWYSDVLTFGFTVLLEVSGWLLVCARPSYLPALGGPLLVLPLTFWVTSLLRTLWGLRATRRCTWAEAFGAAGILWSLGWVVTLACFQGMIQRQGVFLRTQKVERAGVPRALRSTIAETTLGLSCWALRVALLAPRVVELLTTPPPGNAGASGPGVLGVAPSWWLAGTSALLLGVLAFLQGIPYLSAPALCLLSLRTEATAREVRRRALGRGSGEGIVERRLAVGALVIAAALALLLFAANLLPQATTPSPARRQALKQLLGGPNPATSTAPPKSTPGGATPMVTGGPTPQSSATPAPSPSVTVTAVPQPSATSSPTPPSPTPTP